MAALTANITHLALRGTPGPRRPATSTAGTEAGDALCGTMKVYPQLSGVMSIDAQLSGVMKVYPQLSGKMELNPCP